MKWVCIISGVMALLAILPWGYSYYQLLRMILCATSSIVAIGFYKSHLNGWALAFVGIAVLFNPIFPIYMARSSWTGVDVIVGIIFLIASQGSRKK